MRIYLGIGKTIETIEKELPEIAGANFDAIELNPLHPLKIDEVDVDKIPEWMSFQPTAFSIGNQFGTKEQLIHLCKEAKEKYGITIIADVVCCHVANGDKGEFMPHPKVDKRLTSNPYFWKPFRNITNWEDRQQVISLCMGNLPALELSNWELQDIIINYINEYIECGVRGFRFDAAKQIALPNEFYPNNDVHKCEFWERVLPALNHREELFIYAEAIFCNRELVDEYNKYCLVITQQVGSDPRKSISYITNHDTEDEHTFGHSLELSEQQIVEMYNVLTDSFMHTQYYPRRKYNNEKQKYEFSDFWKTSELLRSANSKVAKYH